MRLYTGDIGWIMPTQFYMHGLSQYNIDGVQGVQNLLASVVIATVRRRPTVTSQELLNQLYTRGGSRISAKGGGRSRRRRFSWTVSPPADISGQSHGQKGG
jgi:hypothetical protein